MLVQEKKLILVLIFILAMLVLSTNLIYAHI
jgi:hypothetical protein